jgi:hypothetical protein
MTTASAASGPQHLRALARANEVRLARAELKRRVLDGELAVADVILDAPPEAATMTVADLLVSQRRWGRARCRKLLQGIPMSETKTVGTMTDRQRHAMAEALCEQAGEARATASGAAPAGRLEAALA